MRKIIITLSGPSGSGKSYLTKVLARYKRVAAVNEPVSDSLLEKFEREPSKYSYELQNYIIEEKILNIRKLMNDKYIDIIIIDRTVLEDVNIFFKLHHLLGFLSVTEMSRLTALAHEYNRSIIVPRVIKIGLNANKDVLLYRLNNDNKHKRPDWLINSMQLQCALYNEWFKTENFDNFIDTTFLKIIDLQKISKIIIQSI